MPVYAKRQQLFWTLETRSLQSETDTHIKCNDGNVKIKAKCKADLVNCLDRIDRDFTVRSASINWPALGCVELWNPDSELLLEQRRRQEAASGQTQGTNSPPGFLHQVGVLLLSKALAGIGALLMLLLAVIVCGLFVAWFSDRIHLLVAIIISVLGTGVLGGLSVKCIEIAESLDGSEVHSRSNLKAVVESNRYFDQLEWLESGAGSNLSDPT